MSWKETGSTLLDMGLHKIGLVRRKQHEALIELYCEAVGEGDYVHSEEENSPECDCVQNIRRVGGA